MRRYTILLDRDPEDGSYTVTVPALPGVVTQGRDVDEAIAMAREAIICHIEGLQKDGGPIPEEEDRPQLLTVDIDMPAA
jgi:antitoxin HicB